MSISRQALIIGGSRGIGYSIALKFAQNGYNIAIMSRNSDSLAKGVDSLKQWSESNTRVAISGQVCDVSSLESVEESVKNIDRNNGNIEVLVNASAISSDKLLFNSPKHMINDVIDTNLKGTVYTCKAVLKQMIRQRKGSIVNIGSVVGLKGNIGQTIYSASKAGLIGFTKSLAKEVGPIGIRVNLIAPGFVRTDMTSGLIEAKYEDMIPLKRIASPQEMANAVYFLANASYITGEVLVADGGLHLVM